MNKTINNIKCESYVAFTDNSELFIKSVENVVLNGRTMSNHLKNIRTEFNIFGCMDSYWNWATSVRLRKDFYFGFMLQPSWIEDVIDEFNSVFKNFSIEIIWKKDWNILLENDWDENGFYYTDDDYKKVHSKAGSYIFKLKEHIELKPDTRRKILYLFHHLLRSTSVPERIFFFSQPPPYVNYIDFVLDKNNRSNKGRSLTDYFVNKEDFLALDDEKVLESFDDLVFNNTIKQSDILYIVSQIKKHGREYFEEIPWEKQGGFPNSSKTFYGIFISEGGYVYIRRKPHGKIIYNNYYYLNAQDFFHARVKIDFVKSTVHPIIPSRCFNEGGLRNFQFFPLVDVFNRYPELNYKIVPKLVELVNETWETTFKVPPKEKFIVE